jgi:hypothetical protein
MSELRIQSVNPSAANVILNLEDDEGTKHVVTINSMDVASLIGVLRMSLEEALGHPAAGNLGMPDMQRVQYVETPETGFFRVFVNEHLYHEYPIALNTTLGQELKLFADRFEARNLAKTTHQPPGSPDRIN